MKKKKTTPDDFYSVDSPPIPTEMIKKMRPFKESHPDWPDFIQTHTIGDVEEWKKELKPRRGSQKEPTKTKVTIRLTPRVVEHFKSQGKGWQTRMDNVLCKYIESQQPPSSTG